MPTLPDYLSKWSFRDVLDKKYVYVKASTVLNAGEGLYAAKDIPANTTFVLYGGYLFDQEQYKVWPKKSINDLKLFTDEEEQIMRK